VGNIKSKAAGQQSPTAMWPGKATSSRSVLLIIVRLHAGNLSVAEEAEESLTLR
jgi:hypothetical protein